MTGPALLLVVIGPLMGSFAGLLADRVPAGRGWVGGRSRCDGCGAPLSPLSLVPIISFAFQRGRARCCKAPLSPAHPLIELICLAVPLGAIAAGQSGLLLVASCALGWALVALSAIDLASLTLPDGLTLPLVAIGLGLALGGLTGAPIWHIAGAALGYAIIRGLNAAYRGLRGQDGIGGGDAKLFAAAGAWLGAVALPSVLLLACLSGLAAALVLHLRGAAVHRDLAIPFGPPLALGFWIIWLAGPLFWSTP